MQDQPDVVEEELPGKMEECVQTGNAWQAFFLPSGSAVVVLEQRVWGKDLGETGGALRRALAKAGCARAVGCRGRC